MKEKLPPGARPEIRIVGHDISEKGKKEANKLLAGLFGESHLLDLSQEIRDKLKENEKEKDQIDVDIIRLANDITNELLEDLGCQTFDIPENNIHILPSGYYKEVHPSVRKSLAVTLIVVQAILINDELKTDPHGYAESMAHEMSHLKGYFAEELVRDIAKETAARDRNNHYDMRNYRAGLSIFSLSKKDRRLKSEQIVSFKGLNEAVVSSIDEECGKEVLARANLREISSQEKKEGNFYISLYYGQKRVLNFIIDSIAEREGVRAEDIRRQFYKAHFDGKILGLARMIEKTFGRGSFRFIGTMDKDDDSAKRVLDYLQKQKRLMVSGHSSKPNESQTIIG